MEPIRCRETTEPLGRDPRRDALALNTDPSRQVTLRFHLALSGAEDLEALRYARRVMIREERARGLEWNESSIEEPLISSTEIQWVVPESEVARSRDKIRDLIARANWAREQLRRPL